MGAYIPSQLGINRPHPLLSGTRTPIDGLYLCGSSTGNGGGINGAPGYIAANTIADDLGLKVPWARVPAQAFLLDRASSFQSLLQPNLGPLTGHSGDVAPTSVKGVGNVSRSHHPNCVFCDASALIAMPDVNSPTSAGTVRA